MAKCIKLQRKHRKVCIGDLDTEIVLQDRAITAPTTTVDFSETFTENATVWARVETKRGKTVFDQSNVERDISHEFSIRYITGVTAATWVLHNGKRLDIVDLEDLEERNEWLILRCAERGVTTKAVNDA